MEKPLALIVEDERDIAALFRHVLDIAGYHTEIVMNGKDTLARLESTRPDIILLDLNLPGVSGTQILEQLHADRRLAAVPVVVITGHAEMAASLPFEPDLILLKPVNLDQLSSLVQRLRKTQGGMNEVPWDKVTHLYNREFFANRLAYSLDRARQISQDHFGVLFIDFAPFEVLKGRLDKNQLNFFLRNLALHLKALLRPTDTISHFEDGLFLILIEEVSGKDVPNKIVRRVETELARFLSLDRAMFGLQTYVGIVLCDRSYEGPEQILRDISFARILVKNEKKSRLYDREFLAARRNSVPNS
jgi:diguanylate cyclase (GGDEF)-like protein